MGIDLDCDTFCGRVPSEREVHCTMSTKEGELDKRYLRFILYSSTTAKSEPTISELEPYRGQVIANDVHCVDIDDEIRGPSLICYDSHEKLQEAMEKGLKYKNIRKVYE